MLTYPKSLKDTTTLNNGVEMPWVGLGVFMMQDGKEASDAVRWAVEAGYRSIDTAAVYKNEKAVGQGIKDSGVDRSKLFVTSKVWNSDLGYESTLKAFQSSLKRLKLDYLDLYLIHWPVEGKYKDSWKALEKLYKDGYVRSIGLSNFHENHIEDILSVAEVIPQVDQIECHPKLNQKELIKYTKKHRIQFEAWSPLMHGELLMDKTIVQIAHKYKKTPAQLLIRWDLENGLVTIPKTSKKDRIESNANVFDFTIEEEDKKILDSMNDGSRWGPDPDDFDLPEVLNLED